MSAVQRLVGKLGVIAVGVVTGLTIAAGGAAAAVHVTGTMASGPAIAAQSSSSVGHSVGKEDSRVSGSVDKVIEKKEALEPARSASALKARDDSAGKASSDPKSKDDSVTKAVATEDSARHDSKPIVVVAKAIEPSDKLDK
jgi:hypothetical protein